MSRRDVNAALSPRVLFRRYGFWIALVLAVVLGHWVFLDRVSSWVQGSESAQGSETKTSNLSPTWKIMPVPANPAPHSVHPPTHPTQHPAPKPVPTSDPVVEPVAAESPLAQDNPNPAADAVPSEASVAETAPALPATEAPAIQEAPADPMEADLQMQARWPTEIPKSVDLNYGVKGQYSGFPLIASAVIHWQNQGDSYQAQAEVSLLGFKAVQRSQGQLGPQGLAPVRFSDKRRSEIAAHFNAEKKLITYSANTPDAPLRVLQQDQLSVFIQLASWVAADPARFHVGTRITVPVSSARGPDFWLFSIDGPEMLALADRKGIPTLKLHRILQKETDTAGEVWLAPSLQYLPARIKLTDARGNVVDQTLDP